MPFSIISREEVSPYTQSFSLIRSDGSQVEASMDEVDHWRLYGIRLAINYGSQIGASAILLLVLLVLTKREKRKSLIFVTNALCLVLNTIRSLLQCLFLTGNYYNLYLLLSNDTSRVNSHDRANTVASNTMTLLLVICIMFSLSMQVWVVCSTTPKFQRLLIMCLTSVIAIIAVGYRFTVTVISSHLALKDMGMEDHQSLVTTMGIFQAIAIWLYCSIFSFKLGYAIMQRRKLGITQFGPMQIIFIMGCQTMIVPAIFSVLQFYDQIPELGSQTLTVVCIFLPLSAIWAGVIANDANIGFSGSDAHQRIFQNEFGKSSIGSTMNSRHGNKKDSVTGNASFVTNSPKDPESPTTLFAQKPSSHGGIHIDSEWHVERGQPSNIREHV